MVSRTVTRLQTSARGVVSLAVLCCPAFAATAAAQDFEKPPISYSTAAPDNPVSQLIERVQSGEVTLPYDEQFGYLKPLLRELQIPESSQMLVFSKTSMQRNKISPRTPRAIYFSDEVYVGYCHDGEVLEISVADPALGTVFYTVRQQDPAKAKIVRETDSCLICHGSSHSQGVPGHLVRSVYSDASGFPILSSGSHRIDQTSPIEQRWGGWYVTGTHGKQMHLGNFIFKTTPRPEQTDVSAGMNLAELDARVDRSKYLTPHSDLVALMVLEHQAQGHTLIARANFLTRVALDHEKNLNQELGEAPDHRWDSTTSRIKDAGDPLVKYLLMSGEAKLTARMRGTSDFAVEFAARGPRDAVGRSLRDLDLERRLFKYPCSYLVYSPSFDALPAAASEYVYQRMWDILSGKDTSEDFAHLTSEDRTAIREILRSTKSNLPEYWQ